jgi:signal transduction histidine kinase
MVQLSSLNPAADLTGAVSRRRLLLSGFGVMVLVLLSGFYFVFRSVSRELAVARLQSEFVSAVSHEFRTPLTSLRQLSEMLSGGRIEKEEQKRQSYDILVRESERLQRLVESLLDFGRMEARAFRYQFQELEPSALVDEVVAEFQREIASRGYVIERAESGPFPTVRADRDALRLALWNLLDNAVKYSPDCRTVWTGTSREGAHVAIAVRDRGMGIPASEQKQIFQKFTRGEAARKANVKGTGIGLALVRHIVDAHRGEIRIESAVGQGSTFTILIPAEAKTS